MALIKWDAIDGVPVHYARDQVPALRNPGSRRTFRSTRAFKNKLDKAFAELWDHSGLGRADAIVSAGAFVAKPGQHGAGRAFDLDGLVWFADDRRPERMWWAIDFKSDAAFYWGVGGVLNRHFRYVLHAAYNQPHEDHYHIDDTHRPGFASKAKSSVTYVQAALTHVHGVPTLIDGVFGDQSTAAVRRVLSRSNLPGDLSKRSTWDAFNLATAQLGMGATAPAPVGDPDRRNDLTEDPSQVTPAGDHEQPCGGQSPAAVRYYLRTPRLRGDKVKELQRALKEAGFRTGRVDGIFGSKTKRAVIAYQRANNLEPDGVVGPITSAHLEGFQLA